MVIPLKGGIMHDIDKALAAFDKLTEDELSTLKFVLPWQSVAQESDTDPDGFSQSGSKNSGDIATRSQLQQVCWEKFNQNPHINTSVRGQVGRLAGNGFEVSSELFEIQEVLEELEFDPRNRLYSYWPKYVGRSIIEGELHLCLTLHDNGFVEVDFIDPGQITGGGDDGIIYHPTKQTMPLFYYVQPLNTTGVASTKTTLIPSIFLARYPELIKEAKKVVNFNSDMYTDHLSSNKKFKSIGGFRRFIVSWDKSFVTKRNVSYLKTILEWLNHYENLKKYEIDHKKSAGSYLWAVTMEDAKTFKMWLSLSDEERRKTGIMAKKTPGGTLVLPPGMSIEAMSPSLPSISETDTDILHMITAGLNEPEDVTSGQSKGTFASVKASRGPMSDRIADEVCYFEKFLRHDFYANIFFLRSNVTDFPEFFTIKQAVSFKEQEPVFKKVKKRPEFLIDVTFPTSEVNDMEARARALLGVKHGSTYETLGIPNEEIAKRMGFGNYRRLRLRHATEEDKYPELYLSVDQEAVQGGNKQNSGDPSGNQKNPDAKPVVKPKLKPRAKPTEGKE
jgi:hypothetical protein